MIHTKAKDLYERGCNEYLKLFCKKHGFDYDDARNFWVGGEIGTIVECADYYVDMATIIADIDEEAPECEFLKYYDYCLDAGEFGITTPNFRSWIKGCPRTSPEVLKRLRELKQEISTTVFTENERL